MEKALDDLETTKEHAQKIKIGGILKHMLDLWTIEDIFQACIICTFWLCGKIQMNKSEDGEDYEISIECNDMLAQDAANYSPDTQKEEIIELEDEFVKNMISNFEESQKTKTNKNNFNINEIKTLVKLTFYWISEIKKSQNQYSDFENCDNKMNLSNDNIYKEMSTTKVEKYGV
jgi:CRISPR/Cas system CMR subunit Cmr4 (Cas7 group RAMP superfamily)